MQHALLIALVAAAYLLFAGSPGWTTLPLLALALVAALAAPRRTWAFPRPLRALDAALVTSLAAIAFQLVPLPRAVVAWLSPRAEAVRSAVSLAPLPEGWLPLSLDPPATAQALGNLALATLTYWVARAVFSAGGGVRRYCRALAGLGAVAAVVAAVQRAIDPTLVLGLVRVGGFGTPFGAFVNRNHFAAWLLMIVALSAGYFAAHARIHLADQRGWRNQVRTILTSGGLLTLACVALMLVVLLLTLSRSAAIGMGAAAVTAWLLARHRVAFDRRSTLVILGLAGAAILVGSAFVDLDAWADRLQHSFGDAGQARSRLVIWRETLPMMRDFWLTGTGAGAYGTGILVYQQSRTWIPHLAGWTYFNQAHSHYVQVAAEGGLLLVLPAAAGLAALVVLGRRALAADRGEIYWVRVGAAAGLAGIAAQSVWETALRLPANAVLSATLVAVLLHQRREAHHPHHRADAD